MSHATCMQGNRGDFLLLVVGGQIANLIPGLSFDHNLCFRCPNGLCKPISNIYVPRVFQWYKGRFNPMNFDPCNGPLKIWESIKSLTPKVGAFLGVWGFLPSHSPTLSGAWDVTFGLLSWPTTLQALTLVASPRLGLRHFGSHFRSSTYFSLSRISWSFHSSYSWIDSSLLSCIASIFATCCLVFIATCLCVIRGVCLRRSTSNNFLCWQVLKVTLGLWYQPRTSNFD